MLKGLKKVVMVIGVIAIMMLIADKTMDEVVNHGIANLYTDEECVYAEAVKTSFGSYTIKAEYASDKGNRYCYEEDDINLIQGVISYIIE